MSSSRTPSRRRNVTPSVQAVEPVTARDYRSLLGLVAIIVFLVCFKPIIALTQYAAMDDLGYMKIAADFLSIDYPAAPPNSYPPGVAVAWLPAGLAAIVYRWLFHVSEGAALPIFVGLLSYAYWVASLFLLAAMIRLTSGVTLSASRLALESSIALLGVPLLYYATHRTSMVHSPEFFFALATAFFVLKHRPVLAFGSALMVFSLRLNDVPVLLFAFASVAGASWSSRTKKRLVLGIGTLGLASALAYVVWLGFVAGYNRYNFSYLISSSVLTRVPVVLFGGDWGLLWTAPAWLLCLAAAAVRWRRMSRASKLAFVWMLSELVICFAWPGNGSDFGYRYLIGSYAGAIVIACDVINQETPRRLKQAIRVSWAASAVWLTWVAWIYKERPEFTPYPTLDRLWTHPELMGNSLAALFSLENFLLPLPHSTLGAIYYTLNQPVGIYALPGSTGGPKFQILVAACVLLISLGIWLAVHVIYARDRESRLAVRP